MSDSYPTLPESCRLIRERLDRASQEERISILKMALAEKGVHSGSHYDLAPKVTPEATQAIPRNGTTMTTAISEDSSELEDDGEGGVHL